MVSHQIQSNLCGSSDCGRLGLDPPAGMLYGHLFCGASCLGSRGWVDATSRSVSRNCYGCGGSKVGQSLVNPSFSVKTLF